MGDDNVQFDSLLGGAEELPPTMTLAKFVAYRSQEIQIMKNSLVAQSGGKLAFQTLPKHMRRRAMSHNVKRLPRRLRQIHLNQMKKSGMPAKQKRPSRKHRRRPRNLIEEYTKRSTKKYRWLQTHIWHAKRFHMVEKWGYKLPCHPRDKAFRACYRAITQHCLLQDVSYLKCIEISGDKSFIIDKFKLICQANLGLSIGAKSVINGNREGELIIFEIGSSRAVGDINFHWQPHSENEISKLWLWVHAAFYNDVLQTLIKCFDLTLISSEVGNYYYNDCSDTTLSELTELNRFRLIGPLANSLVQDAFVVVDVNKADLKLTCLKGYTENTNRQALENQSNYWKNIRNISSLSEISPHIILSLIVEDPRLSLPKKRIKCLPEFEIYRDDGIPEDIAKSPLWYKDYREEVNNNKVPNSKISELQSRLLVPGSNINEYPASIPIILIQRPGKRSENNGFGSGWDLILPSTWAKPFWISLIMRGARVGGLREFNSMLFEMGTSQFLRPDTAAGMEEENRISKECVEEFFKKPPNKRVNYNKFNIASPFHWNWKLLIANWKKIATPIDDFVVLRDKKILTEIELLLNSKANSIPELPENCLIPVKLECEKRGSPGQFAIICLPKFKKDLTHTPVEPNCDDKYQTERKELRQAHHLILKKLKKQRKMKSQNNSNLELLHKEVLTNYTKKIRALWLPQSSDIRNSCSREIIGFVKKGGFSFSQGKSCATGYIVADALPSLIQLNPRNKILVRNTNSKQYKVVKLNVILE